MHFRLHCVIHFLIAFALGVASLAAHAQTAPATAATSNIHGHISDQTGALIPGAKVTVTTADGKTAGTATADASGAYTVNGLTTGSYIVQAEYPGFAPFQSQAIPVAAGQNKRVDIAMAIEVEQQSVTVTDDAPQVNVEAGGNANSLVLKDKDLDALSDDPDELSNELSALAGPQQAPTAARSISTDSAAGSFRRSRRFARSASIRIHFQRSLTASVMDALKFSPSRERTNYTDSFSSRATTKPSTPATHLRPRFHPITATSSMQR